MIIPHRWEVVKWSYSMSMMYLWSKRHVFVIIALHGGIWCSCVAHIHVQLAWQRSVKQLVVVSTCHFSKHAWGKVVKMLSCLTLSHWFGFLKFHFIQSFIYFPSKGVMMTSVWLVKSQLQSQRLTILILYDSIWARMSIKEHVRMNITQKQPRSTQLTPFMTTNCSYECFLICHFKGFKDNNDLLNFGIHFRC